MCVRGRVRRRKGQGQVCAPGSGSWMPAAAKCDPARTRTHVCHTPRQWVLAAEDMCAPGTCRFTTDPPLRGDPRVPAGDGGRLTSDCILIAEHRSTGRTPKWMQKMRNSDPILEILFRAFPMMSSRPGGPGSRPAGAPGRGSVKAAEAIKIDTIEVSILSSPPASVCGAAPSEPQSDNGS